MSELSINELIERCERAVERDEPISADDVRLIIEIIKGYFFLQGKISANDVTLAKLRKLIGMESSSEKGRDVFPQADKKDNYNSKPEQPGHGKSGVEDFPKAEVIRHEHTELTSGDSCPICHSGKIYKFRPSEFVRIVGTTPLKPEIHIIQQLRCNLCGEVFKAKLSDAVLADGASHQRFGYSARSLIALFKYSAGTPFYRQHVVQKMMGVQFDPTTLWDQCEALSNAVKPVFESLQKMAADGEVFFADDTSNRILSEQGGCLKIKRGTDKLKLRTGINSSGVIALTRDGRKISLFKTGINHAGEYMDELLTRRTSPEKFKYMSDGLSSNSIAVKPSDYIKLYCNVHARREFVDIAEKFPEESKFIIDQYELIYANEKVTRIKKMSDTERLDYHKENSLPLMEEMFLYLRELSLKAHAEPNGPLGKAIQYFLKREKELKTFCEVAGAPLDNNPQEQNLKRVVLQRKNSLFFKEKIGAKVSDIIMSLCQTATDADENVFEYLTVLQRHADAVRKTPEQYLPWNYQSTVAGHSSNH